MTFNWLQTPKPDIVMRYSTDGSKYWDNGVLKTFDEFFKITYIPVPQWDKYVAFLGSR